jgi:hypothetical protein
MSPVQQNIENLAKQEKSPLSNSEIGESLGTSGSAVQVDASEAPESSKINQEQGSSSAQAINETRIQEGVPTLNNAPVRSELSRIATYQREKLNGQIPSAGYGTENLPFAA